MANDVTTTKKLVQCESVRDMLRHPAATEQLRRVAASAVDPNRMLRTIAMAFPRNPLLAECEPMSFLGSMMTAASLGLMPQTMLGECYLVPFKNSKLSKKVGRDVYEVQLIVGYRGYEKLARRSGGLISIHADIPTREEWESGDFDFQYGTGQFLKHRAVEPDGEPMWAYAHAQLKDGEAFIVWTYTKVLQHRDRFSQAYRLAKNAAKDSRKAWMLDETPWVKHEGAMARKTMIRQLAPRLDLTVDAESAMSVDEARNLNYAGFALERDLKPGDIPEPLDGEAEPEPDPEDAEEVTEPEPEEPKGRDKKASPAKQDKASAGKGASAAGEAPASGKGAERAAQAPTEASAESEPKGEAGLFPDETGDDRKPPSEADQFKALADRIIEEIDDAADANAISGVLGVWDSDLRRMQERAESEYQRVDGAATAAMDRLARGDD